MVIVLYTLTNFSFPHTFFRSPEEQHHRYSNAALRMNNGVEIEADEQQRLLAHSRAVTEAMSEEVKPVAESTEEQYQCSSVAKPVAECIEESSVLLSDNAERPAGVGSGGTS